MSGNLAHDALAGVVYADDPVLLLFGQSEKGFLPGREATERAGLHLCAEVPVEEGPERLDRQVGLEVALVMAEQPSPQLDRLMARLGGEARSGRLKTVIVAPTSMIDAVTVEPFHKDVEHLIDPMFEDVLDALARAGTRPSSVLHDIGRRNGSTVLQQLSEEAARIANVLATLSGEEAGAAAKSPQKDEGEEPAIGAAFVRSIIRARRMRDQFLRGGLFADPAWDMLLDLMAARLEGNRVAVSSLCIASAVPATTALRWIKALTDRGLFIRSADPQDGRRVYIELSSDAARAMGRYLEAVQRSGGLSL